MNAFAGAQNQPLAAPATTVSGSINYGKGGTQTSPATVPHGSTTWASEPAH